MAKKSKVKRAYNRKPSTPAPDFTQFATKADVAATFDSITTVATTVERIKKFVDQIDKPNLDYAGEKLPPGAYRDAPAMTLGSSIAGPSNQRTGALDHEIGALQHHAERIESANYRIGLLIERMFGTSTPQQPPNATAPQATLQSVRTRISDGLDHMFGLLSVIDQ